MQMMTLDDLVSRRHLVRKLEMALDWSFIYGLAEPLYCEYNGQPSTDPVMLVKLTVISRVGASPLSASAIAVPGGVAASAGQIPVRPAMRRPVGH